MNIYKCKKKCCKVKIKQYKSKPYRQRRPNRRKAGVFIYDPKEQSVLLVQSRGSLWGCPKGTLNTGEKPIKGAIREVMEETGIDLCDEWFTDYINIKNRVIYYYLEMNFRNVEIQTHLKDNDANGVTWIKISCLEEFIRDGNMVLSHYTKIVFKKFINKLFPKSNFKKVTYNNGKKIYIDIL